MYKNGIKTNDDTQCKRLMTCSLFPVMIWVAKLVLWLKLSYKGFDLLKLKNVIEYLTLNEIPTYI